MGKVFLLQCLRAR